MSGTQRDVSVSNLCSDFIPEMVQLTTKSDTKLDVAKLETSKQELKVVLNM